jgi:hypothetical protein
MPLLAGCQKLQNELVAEAEHGPHYFGEKAWATEMAAMAGAFAIDPPGELFRGVLTPV